MQTALVESRAHPLESFELLCWAKARLYGEWQIELADAVDDLMAFAVREGLVRLIGVDEVQRLMAIAFRPWRD